MDNKERTLILLEKTFMDGFGVVPFSILRNPNIPPQLKTLYILLLSYAWYQNECFPGQDKLAQELGVSDRTIVSQLQGLKDLGLIDWKRRGLGQTNVYYIMEIPESIRYKKCEGNNMGFEPEVKPTSLLEVKPTSLPIYEVYEEETDKDNGASPSFFENSSKKDVNNLKDTLMKRLEGMGEKSSSRVTLEWQDTALRYANGLGISFDDESALKVNLRGRWFKFFKDAWGKNEKGRLQVAYTFVSDYPKSMSSAEKAKLFFWKVVQP